MPERSANALSGTPVVTVVVTTRNRRDELCLAIDSVLRQTVAVEILVMDDASTDGTRETVNARYPGVIVIRSEERLGLVVQRNRAATLARGTIIVSLDDDAALTSSTTIAEVLVLFRNPRVGAVAIPIVNVIGGVRSRIGPPRAPGSGVWVVPVFAGGAHAVNRELFLSLGGYEGGLFQWGEETNFCAKLYGSGHVVALADCTDVEHRPNPVGRHARAKNVWIYRNTIINVFLAAPWWLVPPLCLLETARLVARALRHPASLPVTLEGLVRGYLWSLAQAAKRQPVGTRVYLAWLRLRRAKVQTLEALEPSLPRRMQMTVGAPTVAADG